MASLSRQLVEAALAVDELPPSVEQAARLHFLDALGVGLAARSAGPLAGLTLGDAAGPASVFGSADGTTAATAALVNGTLIHSLEYDDTHVPSVMHGSSVLVPAALAEAETVGASGRAMLRAYALGWELLIRLGLASPGALQARGFQTTSAAGPFAAALVSALLHGDPASVAVHALGIAGSQAGGNFSFLTDGATVKAAQPGWAAHSGLLAAALARGGVTGPAAVFEGDSGFFSLYASDPDAAARLRTDLGTQWFLPEAAFKLHPCCHFIHPFLECLDHLTADGLLASDVTFVHCHVPAEQAPIIAEPWPDKQNPRSAQEARWSLPYALAAHLTDGLTPAHFVGDADPRLVALAARITWEPWKDSGYPTAFPARLSVRTTSGDTLTASVDDVRGSAARPLSRDDVTAKFTRNASLAGLTAAAGTELISDLLDSPDPSVALLGHHLRRPR